MNNAGYFTPKSTFNKQFERNPRNSSFSKTLNQNSEGKRDYILELDYKLPRFFQDKSIVTLYNHIGQLIVPEYNNSETFTLDRDKQNRFPISMGCGIVNILNQK